MALALKRLFVGSILGDPVDVVRQDSRCLNLQILPGSCKHEDWSAHSLCSPLARLRFIDLELESRFVGIHEGFFVLLLWPRSWLRAAAIASFRVRCVELARFAPGFLTTQLVLGVRLRPPSSLAIANPHGMKAVSGSRAWGVNSWHS